MKAISSLSQGGITTHQWGGSDGACWKRVAGRTPFQGGPWKVGRHPRWARVTPHPMGVLKMSIKNALHFFRIMMVPKISSWRKGLTRGWRPSEKNAKALRKNVPLSPEGDFTSSKKGKGKFTSSIIYLFSFCKIGGNFEPSFTYFSKKIQKP